MTTEMEQLKNKLRATWNAGDFSEIAKSITAAVPIPTIGIGAGPDCDGQVLVIHDVLGMTTGYVPRFVRSYAKVGETIKEATAAFAKDVRGGEFPGPSEAFK